jgi:hypothetical protein
MTCWRRLLDWSRAVIDGSRIRAMKGRPKTGPSPVDRTQPASICGRAYSTPCIHEHACLRCSMHWPDPAQWQRIVEIRDNLIARIAEAEREGWLGEVEGLRISLAGANDKLAQIDKHTNATGTVNLGMPTLARDS